MLRLCVADISIIPTIELPLVFLDRAEKSTFLIASFAESQVPLL